MHKLSESKKFSWHSWGNKLFRFSKTILWRNFIQKHLVMEEKKPKDNQIQHCCPLSCFWELSLWHSICASSGQATSLVKGLVCTLNIAIILHNGPKYFTLIVGYKQPDSSDIHTFAPWKFDLINGIGLNCDFSINLLNINHPSTDLNLLAVEYFRFYCSIASLFS